MTDLSATPPPSESSVKWKPLPAIERRVFGVLIEKGKTTPDQYPMSLNGLVAGCNQKSNRYPQMELDADQIQEALDRLRALGAVAEVQGGSRVPRYRHFAYEWLGVNKTELAVMAELLLRGTQTEGDLRGRAGRMEPIADVAALRPVLDAMKAKGLVLSLTPVGRGHTVTHKLYEPRELEKQRAEFAGQSGPEEHVPMYSSQATGSSTATDSSTPLGSSSGTSAAARGVNTTAHGAHAPHGPITQHSGSAPSSSNAASSARELETVRQEFNSLQSEMQTLRSEVRQLKSDLSDLSSAFEQSEQTVRSLKDALGG